MKCTGGVPRGGENKGNANVTTHDGHIDLPRSNLSKDSSAEKVTDKQSIHDTIAYRIFSLYQENTKTIHLIMMILLVNFIISNYKLASGPPKDPGGSKKILSKSRI